MSRLTRNSRNSNVTSLPAELNSSPLNNNTFYEDNLHLEDSPIYLPCTQDGQDNIDVIWDWHSPSSSKPRHRVNRRPRNLRKCTTIHLSVPVRKDKPDLEKVKNDLESLVKEIGKSQEDSYNENSIETDLPCETTAERDAPSLRTNDSNLNAFFNDTIEDELIIVSQVVEQTLLNTKPKIIAAAPDDSFDMALKAFEDEDIELLTQAVVACQPTTKPDASQNAYERMETQRNFNFVQRSLSNTFISDPIGREPSPIKCSPEEIEKKRLEALAKLESKKMLATTQRRPSRTLIRASSFVDEASQIDRSSNDEGEKKRFDAKERSPMKCSPEEIEKKRLEALAKLEAKKMIALTQRQRSQTLIRAPSFLDASPIECSPDEIERKRLEALAKLEARKKSLVNDVQTLNEGDTMRNGSQRAETSPIKFAPDEIERKRLEALAKLEAKKYIAKTNAQPSVVKENRWKRTQSLTYALPMKFSPEEIETKRLEALAKLEAKKPSSSVHNAWHRTSSFVETSPPMNVSPDGAERKRLMGGKESPGRCSSVEIERKRLEALAKLEARKRNAEQPKRFNFVNTKPTNAEHDSSIKLEARKQLFSCPLSVNRCNASDATEKRKHEESDVRNIKQKCCDVQVDKIELNKREALRRLQLSKQRKMHVT